MCVELPKVCSRMADWLSWTRLCNKCERVYACYAGSHDEIPTEFN